jgi:hypothetical protein
MAGGGGNPDPSRGGARDRLADGRDDRGGLQDSVGGVGAPPARRRAGLPPDTSANSRRARDRRRDKCRRAAHTLGRCAPAGPIPRGRSAERASSTTYGDIRQNGQRLIRPAAASIRSRGPGGDCSRSSRLAQPRHTLSQSSFSGSLTTPPAPRFPGHPASFVKTGLRVADYDLTINPIADVGGPLLASKPGSILASAEGRLRELVHHGSDEADRSR